MTDFFDIEFSDKDLERFVSQDQVQSKGGLLQRIFVSMSHTDISRGMPRFTFELGVSDFPNCDMTYLFGLHAWVFDDDSQVEPGLSDFVPRTQFEDCPWWWDWSYEKYVAETDPPEAEPNFDELNPRVLYLRWWERLGLSFDSLSRYQHSWGAEGPMFLKSTFGL